MIFQLILVSPVFVWSPFASAIGTLGLVAAFGAAVVGPWLLVPVLLVRVLILFPAVARSMRRGRNGAVHGTTPRGISGGRC